MSGAGFILAINLLVAGLFAASFMMIAVHDVRQRAAPWLALAYATGMAYSLVEFAIPFATYARPVVVASFAVFLAAMVLFNAGVARKYDRAIPWGTMVATSVASIVAVYFVQDLPRHSFARMMTYQAPYAIMQGIGIALIWSARSRLRWLDWLFFGLLIASAVQFLSKPLIAQHVGGWGENPQAYLQSTYALISQTMGTVFGVAVALLALVILVRDLLVDAAQASETDTLSGLLNRRGFERHADCALSKAEREGMPVSLVICDLDRFKSINDTYGHASGDEVIRAFSGFLRSMAAEHHVVGRLGGEEFALVLPGTNLIAARLFAEGVRSAFASMAIDGFSPQQRFTASFGVAERAAGEGIASLLARADEALYEAKKAGRDCVRVSFHRMPPNAGIAGKPGRR